VSLGCTVISLIVIYILLQYAHATPLEALHLLGWWPIHPVAVVQTVLLCSILFVGPLFEAGFVEGRFGAWIRGTYFRETFGSWIGWRNLVAGPVTEELTFRSLIIPLHLMAHMPPSKIVFVTPLYFGIAHVHHFYEFVLTHPEFPILPAILRTLVQFTYTSLFGFFAAFVFLRTGSLYAAIAAHTFCNWMGLPRFWGRVGAAPKTPIRPPGSKKSDDVSKSTGDGGSNKAVPRERDLSTVWTVVYYLLLVVGMVGFKQGLWALTESSGALASFPQRKAAR
jgi:prenyl protein peptidase